MVARLVSASAGFLLFVSSFLSSMRSSLTVFHESQCWVCRYLTDEDINNYIVNSIVEGLEDPVFNAFI